MLLCSLRTMVYVDSATTLNGALGPCVMLAHQITWALTSLCAEDVWERIMTNVTRCQRKNRSAPPPLHGSDVHFEKLLHSELTQTSNLFTGVTRSMVVQDSDSVTVTGNLSDRMQTK